MANKKYPREFKLRVAREANQPENENLEHVIATKYGIRVNTVMKWRLLYQQYGADAFSRRTPKLKPQSERSEREKELEKENAALREEVEILKKAAAFLADLRRE